MAGICTMVSFRRTGIANSFSFVDFSTILNGSFGIIAVEDFNNDKKLQDSLILFDGILNQFEIE